MLILAGVILRLWEKACRVKTSTWQKDCHKIICKNCQNNSFKNEGPAMQSSLHMTSGKRQLYLKFTIWMHSGYTLFWMKQSECKRTINSNREHQFIHTKVIEMWGYCIEPTSEVNVMRKPKYIITILKNKFNQAQIWVVTSSNLGCFNLCSVYSKYTCLSDAVTKTL